jgi:hypothetical protein
MAAAVILKLGYTSWFCNFELGMLFVCYQFASKSGGNCPFYSTQYGGGHLET